MAVAEHEVAAPVKRRSRSGEKAEGSRLTVTVTLDPQTYEKVTKEAARDERTPARWLARFVKRELGKPVTESI